MGTPFFITGLPCSRTSWLANLFCHNGVFCHHDLLAECATLDDYLLTLAAQAQEGRVGDSDSGLLECHGRVMAMWPEARWLLVSRPFEDAWQSLCAFVQSGVWGRQLCCDARLREAMLAGWTQARGELIRNPRVMEVAFDSLERPLQIEAIWRHLAPGVKFDARRAAALQKFNVRPEQAKCAALPRATMVESFNRSAA